MAPTVVNGGKAIAANRLKGSGTEPKYVGWGTSTTAEAASQTGLQAAASEARATGTSSVTTTNVTNDTYEVIGTITCAGSGKTITEVATFDDPTTGSMMLRAVHNAQVLSVGDGIQYTIDVVFG